jgi:methylmalonyl-CoA mutase cobalamin-binding subunit
MAHIGGVFRQGTTQVVAVTSTSATHTTAFQAGTNVVRVQGTVNMHIKIGPGTATATTSDMKLAPGVPEYFAVTPGQKVVAIRTTTSGSLFVTEVS